MRMPEVVLAARWRGISCEASLAFRVRTNQILPVACKEQVRRTTVKIFSKDRVFR